MTAPAEPAAPVLARRSPWLVRWFTWYSRRYLGKSFHAVRLAWDSRPADTDPGPLVVVLNHPSWWDPLLGVVLAGELFPSRQHFVPLDAAALGKYRFFERLGFFGVEQGSGRGAVKFLRTSLAILSRPGTALWIPAQGRFADPRERPLGLRPGVAHLVHRLEGGTLLPLAVEYPFWEERYPEALARFGRPIPIAACRDLSPGQWLDRIEAELTRTADDLRGDAVGRRAADFETLLGGNVGVGGVYDLWRRLRAWVRGRRFDPAHGGGGGRQ